MRLADPAPTPRQLRANPQPWRLRQRCVLTCDTSDTFRKQSNWRRNRCRAFPLTRITPLPCPSRRRLDCWARGTCAGAGPGGRSRPHRIEQRRDALAAECSGSGKPDGCRAAATGLQGLEQPHHQHGAGSGKRAARGQHSAAAVELTGRQAKHVAKSDGLGCGSLVQLAADRSQQAGVARAVAGADGFAATPALYSPPRSA